jgi:hypothetical protein
LSKILDTPSRPVNLPKNAQWLAGQGAGSWFYIQNSGDVKHHFKIFRYSPKGTLECDRIYKAIMPLDISKPYLFSYLSHCALCTIIQNNKKIILNWIGEK